jgi:putative ATP-dependent endonuclease of OLD family
MAKNVKIEAVVEDVIELGKVRKLTIKNFRAIGPAPVEIDIDNIVVLVGPNNAGKSSILRAYEVVMLEGSSAGKLSLEDFPGGKVVEEEGNYPEIQLETEVVGNPPGKKWLIVDGDKRIVRERWTWTKPGPAIRQGWNTELAEGAGDWDQSKPWGFAAVANARRPQPHAVKAFDTPEDQAKQINNIILSLVQEKAKSLPVEEGGEELEFAVIAKQFSDFQTKVLGRVQDEINTVAGRLTAMMSGVFPDHEVQFDPILTTAEEVKFFSSSRMLVGKKDGFMGPLELQGSGARRTLLWSVLRIVSESDLKNTGRPHLLLIDEPELCLHPSAVREACRVLYDLADTHGWQVMVTTHHPAFIDLARNNKTIVCVERNTTGAIQGTTLFKPSVANLGEDDKQNLKLLNIFDPYVGEFFFSGAVVVVEGDTEYSVFRFLISELLQDANSKIPHDLLKGAHIVRARGKVTAGSLARIMNHFGRGYSILHDLDTEMITKKDKKTGLDKLQKNSAWTNNYRIMTQVEAAPSADKVRLVCSLPDFEQAYLGYVGGTEKPYMAVESVKEDEDAKTILIELLYALLDHSKPLPAGAALTKDTLPKVVVPAA